MVDIPSTSEREIPAEVRQARNNIMDKFSESIQAASTAQELHEILVQVDEEKRHLKRVCLDDEEKLEYVFGGVMKDVNARKKELFRSCARHVGGMIKDGMAGEVRRVMTELRELRGGFPVGAESRVLSILERGFQSRMEELVDRPTREIVEADLDAFLVAYGDLRDTFPCESVRTYPREAMVIVAGLICERLSGESPYGIQQQIKYLSVVIGLGEEEHGVCFSDMRYALHPSILNLRKALVLYLLNVSPDDLSKSEDLIFFDVLARGVMGYTHHLPSGVLNSFGAIVYTRARAKDDGQVVCSFWRPILEQAQQAVDAVEG